MSPLLKQRQQTYQERGKLFKLLLFLNNEGLVLLRHDQMIEAIHTKLLNKYIVLHCRY